MTFTEVNQELIQGSDSWHEWRRQGIGGSDAPVVMGVSPYKTPLELWKEKTGAVTDGFSGNWATRRGNELEPVARKHYELMTDLDMKPALFVRADFPFMRASLDGWNATERRVLEIKCPGRDDHATAKAGEVPEKYFWQLQHQLFVTNAVQADYFSFDGESGVIVSVKPDSASQTILLTKCQEFWGCVEKKTPPALTDRDYVQVCLTEEDEALAYDFGIVTRQIEALEELKKNLRERIVKRFSAVGHPRIQAGNLKIVRSLRKGSLDTTKLASRMEDFLDKAELEKYRKKSTEVVTVTYERDEAEVN